MKIAIILVSGCLVFVPKAVMAQSAASDAGDKPTHAETVKIPHGAAAAAARNAGDTDRAIDAELKRINRMMTICTGC